MHGNSVDVTYSFVADSSAIMDLTFKDRDHFCQEWTLRIDGKNNTTVYEFERVDGPGQPQRW